MILKIPTFHREIDFNQDRIFTWEIKPLPLFYRIVQSLHAISNGDAPVEDVFITDGQKRLDPKKILIILSDPWCFPLADRKIITKLSNVVENTLNFDYEKKVEIYRSYQEMLKAVGDIINELPFETKFETEPNITNIIKLMDVSIEMNSLPDIRSKLLRLIDINASLNIAEIMVLINYRSIMSVEDEIEVFKHAMNSKCKILLVETTQHQNISPYETRWVITDDYDDYICEG